jgi:hypothetical protein
VTSYQRVFVYARGLLLSGILIVAGCSQKHGPATQVYLKTEQGLLKTFLAAYGHEEPIQSPQKPFLPRPATSDEYRAFILAKRQYPHELELYYEKLIARFKRQSGAFAQIQAQMGSLGAADVEPDAVHLVATEETLIGDMRLVLLEASELFDRRRIVLIRAGQSNFFDEICIPAIQGALETKSEVGAILGVFKGFANVAGRNAVERQQISEQFSRLRDSVIAAQRDAIAFQTEKSQILASLSSKYPEQDWDFLKPPGSTN